MATRANPIPVQLRLFGTPSISVGGRAARLPLKRAFALLAWLAFHARPMPRARLAALLWPDADEPQGRTRLRRLMYTIERAIAGPIFLADGDELALAACGLAVDVIRFGQFARRAVAAVSWDDAITSQARQWIAPARLPLLQGVAFGSHEFDDWRKAIAIEHEHLLARLLERLITTLGRSGDFESALALAEQLIELDAFREPSYVLLMQLHALQGHSAGVEAAYWRCAQAVRDEFGIQPGPQTERAYQRLTADLRRLSSHQLERPQVRFAEGKLGAVAYTIVGSADEVLLISPGFVCHIEIALEYPPLREFIDALAQRFRVILFDRSGIGLSERLHATTTPAAMAADMAAILDHAGVARAWVFGSSEGGMGAMRLAVDHPQRVRGLCLFGVLARGSAAPDYPWALPAAAYDVWLQRLVTAWGGPAGIETFAPSEKDDPALRAWWARIVRHAASPGSLKTILVGLRDADLRADLTRIAVPTLVMHRRGDRAVRFEAGRHLAKSIAGAAWLPLDGDDHFWWCGERTPVLEALLQFCAAQSARDGRSFRASDGLL